MQSSPRKRNKLPSGAGGSTPSGSEDGSFKLPCSQNAVLPRQPSVASLSLDSSQSGQTEHSSQSGSGSIDTRLSKNPPARHESNLSSGSRASRRLIAVNSMNAISQSYFYTTHQEYMVEDSTSGGTAPGKFGDEEPVPPRAFCRSHEITNGLVLAFMLALLGFATYNVTISIISMKAYYAISVFLLIPLGIIFFSFAISTVIRGIMSLGFGGTSPLDMNSQNYSAIKTPIPKGSVLPPIVVQMPVYKESLEEVIKLTYNNVKRAMDYYQRQGGRVKYIICDDGFQVISAEEAVARGNFYQQNNIGFVARPPKNRRGVFKKASNLNYQLAVSERMSQLMKENPTMTSDSALLTVWDEYNREFVAAGDLTLEENCLILLIDADTKVPEHCMYDVVGEFIVDKDIAYTQHYTTPFDEQNRNYWEQYISAFTRIIYFQGIAMSVAFGDCAPLVGHNAFLRWSAVRKVGYTDDTCRPNEIKYWSENSVSEDFDMYIRLASIGSFGRYVMYTGPEFQEGVSLCYMDEVIKFKKFAYGACEMIFNPLKDWLFHGPFNKGFRTYILTRDIRWYHKVSMLTYLSSYLAMGSAFYYCMFEAVMSILDPKFHDFYLTRSFDVMLTCNVIFSGIGTICGGVVFQWRRHAADKRANIFKIVWDQLKWIPPTVLFFYSALFFMTEACAMYLFSMNVVWGATAKETSNTTCWQALKQTLVGYKWEYLLYCTVLGGYLFASWYFQVGLYRGWAIPSYMAGHIIGPVILNPRITSLQW